MIKNASNAEDPSKIDKMKGNGQSELNQQNMIGKAEEQQTNMKKQSESRWMMASMVMLSLFIVTMVSCLSAWLLTPDRHERYLILLDAGSVHTSVYTYRYFYPDPDNPSKVHVEETHSCELGQTGISDFKSNPSQAAHWVARSECVQESVARIPADLRPWSRIELCSTAGMRVMRLSDPESADMILANVTEQLTAAGAGQLSAGAKILSGEEEAEAGWVTAWHLSGRRSVGSLDWGGASAQITVPSGDNTDDNNDDDNDDNDENVDSEPELSSVSIHGQSNLCYGQQEALKRHRAGLVYSEYRDAARVGVEWSEWQWYTQNKLAARASILDKAREEKKEVPELKYPGDDPAVPHHFNISDPCLPAGAVLDSVPVSSIFSSPCTKIRNTSFMKMMETSNASISFVSDYNYDTCTSLIQSQFRPTTCYFTWQPMRGEHTCLVPEDIAPPPPGLPYLAMSTYYYISHHIDLNQPFSINDFLNTSRQICGLHSTHHKLQALKKVKASTSACFQSQLMYHLLTSGYHFNETSWSQIQFVKRINGAEVGWGLGYAMIEAEKLGGVHFISSDAMICLLCLAALFLLLSVTAGYKGRCGVKQYSPLGDF